MNTLLLKGVIKKLEERIAQNEALGAGKEEVKFKGQLVLDLDLEVKKSEDTDKKATSSIPILKVLAISMRKSGFMGDKIINHLRECVTEAMNSGSDEVYKVTEKELANISEKLTSQLPRVPVSGKTTVNGFLKEIKVVDIEEK